MALRDAEHVEDADRVVRVDGRHQPIPGVVDGLEMPRRDEAGDAGQRKILHVSFTGRPRAARARARSSVAIITGAWRWSE